MHCAAQDSSQTKDSRSRTCSFVHVRPSILTLHLILTRSPFCCTVCASGSNSRAARKDCAARGSDTLRGPPPPPPNFRTHATLHTRMQASAHRGMQKYPVRCCSIVFMQNVKVVMQHPSSSILSIPNSAKFANSQAMQSRSSHRFHPNIQIHMQCSCPIHCTASSGQLMSPSWQ